MNKNMVALGVLKQFGTVIVSRLTWRKHKKRINRVLEYSEDPVEVRNHRGHMFSWVRKERKHTLQVAQCQPKGPSVNNIKIIHNQAWISREISDTSKSLRVSKASENFYKRWKLRQRPVWAMAIEREQML